MSNLSGMDVFAPNTDERRMLVEILAAELAGDEPVAVRSSVRRRTALALSASQLIAWLDPRTIALSPHGRVVARQLADQMLGASGTHAC
ncbi:MAG: hypothetical protein AAGA54_13445 [Myxococcota bacterium]